MALRAVVLDFYGTLAESRGLQASWDETFRVHGYELSESARHELWHGGTDGIEHDEHSRSRDHYVAWQHSRIRSVIERSGVPAGDDDVLFSALTERLGAHDLTAYDEVDAVLDELRARGFLLAVCSNWDWDLHEAIEAAGLTGRFDVVVSSAWVGARKPHPRIYTHTLAQLDVDPGDTLFVGDTWTCDVVGPRAAGMRPVYLRRPHLRSDSTNEGSEGGDAVVRATDLRVLLDLVEPGEGAAHALG